MPTRRRSAKSTSISKSKRRPLFSLSKLLLDDKNLELVRLLSEEPRMPVSELSRLVGMSAPAVRERVHRLQESGVIARWRIDVDPSALGYHVLTYVRVKPMPGQLPKIAELARRLPQVVECHRITGEDCFIMKVYFAGMDQLDEVLDQFLAHGQTTTSIVQSTPVPLRALPLPGKNGRHDEDEGAS